MLRCRRSFFIGSYIFYTIHTQKRVRVVDKKLCSFSTALESISFFYILRLHRQGVWRGGGEQDDH